VHPLIGGQDPSFPTRRDVVFDFVDLGCFLQRSSFEKIVIGSGSNRYQRSLIGWGVVVSNSETGNCSVMINCLGEEGPRLRLDGEWSWRWQIAKRLSQSGDFLAGENSCVGDSQSFGP
jgi:hypothetical protein